MIRPMREVPICATCGATIWGGKGDWWHETTTLDASHMAIPTMEPAPLAPIIDSVKEDIRRRQRDLGQQYGYLADLLKMRAEESEMRAEESDG